MTIAWHADDQLLGAYRAGSLSLAQASSVETHLVACSRCRAAAAAHADPVRLRRTFTAARALAHAAPPRRMERGLRRLGVDDAAARIVIASPAARRPWVLAALMCAGFATAGAAVEGRAATVVLMLAPLLPLLAVAVAYGPVVDPMAETEAPLPYPLLRIVLLRSVALLVPTVAAMLLASALVPGAPAPTWLLPALGLALLTLVLARGRDPLPYGGALAAAWLLGISVARAALGDASMLYSPGAQVMFGVVVLVCCAALASWLRAPVLRSTP